MASQKNGVDPSALPPSIYSATALPPTDAPPLVGNTRAKVAIVGAGFTGLSAALHLAEAGVAVTVLERHEPGWGASGRNGGQVNPGLKYEPDELESRFGPALGRKLIELSGNAPKRVFELIRTHQIRCEANESGTLRVAFANRGAWTIKSTADAWMKRGMPVRYLDREAVRAATGSDRYLNGVLDLRGGTLNPLSYARGLAGAARAAGAAVHGASPALSLSREDGVWLVTTPTGAVQADWVVLATNGYTDDLWPGLRRSIVPVFSGIIASEPLSDQVAAEILPSRSAVYEIGSVTVYYRVDTGNRVLIGGRSRLKPVAGTDALQGLARYAVRLWPQLSPVRWTHGWNGRIAVTTDHLPHVHEPAQNLIAALGYNGRGVAMATVMGDEIARRITGGAASELALPITPVRQIPFHPLWRVGALARIISGRVVDRLGL